ncbi:MAG: DUF1906 domain-containing protein, partial [Streptosporangiaceae bacterium]
SPGTASPGTASPGTGATPSGPVGAGPAIGTLPQVSAAVTRDAQEQEMHASLADPGVSVTGTYTGDTGGVLSILRSLRREAGHRTPAGAGAGAGRGPARGQAQVMTRSAAALYSGPAATASVLRGAMTLLSTHPSQHRHLRDHRGRRHRHARRHRASRHKASRHKASRHKAAKRHSTKRHARKHRAAKHRAAKHRAAKHRAAKHQARRHHARRHHARKHHARRHHARRHHARRHHARRHHARRHHARKRGTGKHHSRRHKRGRRRAHPRTPRLRQGLRGFDSCTTPSLAAMQAWRRAFSAMAVYIGGVEAGCASANLSADWVHAVTGMGWALIPTYVGPQASCSSFSVRIRPASAVAQGQAAALDAIQQAAALGMGRGTPVYYDMEAYNGHRRRCRDSTLAFLDTWTRTLHAHGYSSGVYASASSGAENLGAARTVDGHLMAEPDSLWFGLWDNERNVRGLPYLLQSWWQGPRRIKQYEGPHKRTVGGFTLDIDSDWVFGAVYR